MEEVRLSEAQKDDILSHVLAKQEKPCGFVWWKALGAIATVIVISLLLTNGIPFGAHSGAASGVPAESAAATVEESEAAPEANGESIATVEEVTMDQGIVTSGEALPYQHEILPIEYEIQEVDHVETINGVEVMIIVKGQEAIWVQDARTHHLITQEPMEEEAFIELIKSLMNQ